MSDTATTTLVCQKCQGAMRRYGRNGVTIDQCQDGRGIFLDRGELERLIDSEEQRYPSPPPVDPPRSREEPAYDQSQQPESKDESKSGAKRRRGGFLGELFE